MTMTSHNNKIAISTEKGGLHPLATEESKGLVKKMYYAMKRKNLFYRFQRSFYPLSGLKREDEIRAHDHHFRSGESITIGDIRYFPVQNSYNNSKTIIPRLIIELYMLKTMLRARYWDTDYDEYYEEDRIPHMSASEALAHYTDYYFSNYRKTKKVKPTGLMFEFFFGIFGLTLFTVILFMSIASIISSAFAYVFGLFIILVTTIVLFVIASD